MKKGFTLIELLAVIIILAVIALIATPIVLDVVESAKLKAFEESAYGIVEMVKLKNYDDMFEGNNNNKTYTFPNDELIFQGERPKGGTVISVNGEIILAINNGKWCASKKLGDDKVVITENLDNCDIKYVNLSGTITETNPIIAKVQLVKNDKVIYETNSGENGYYEFNDIVSDKYLVLVSQPGKTKYGREIAVLDNNATYDMDVKLYPGDINGDNIIDETDTNLIRECVSGDALSNTKCAFADLNGDGLIDSSDVTEIRRIQKKVSSITYLETFNINGKITFDGVTAPTITLENSTDTYTASIDENGEFKLENIPQGFYLLKIDKNYHIGYSKFDLYRSDIAGLNVHVYAGDINKDGVIDETDLSKLEIAIQEGYTPNSLRKFYDLNEDGVIDENDRLLLIENMGK